MQKNKLHTIAHHGHEIAYHTANHPNMLTAVQKMGLQKTLTNEIDSDLTLMRQDGFTVTNFAYPFGRHDQKLDIALLRTFKSVRALSNRQNYLKSLVKYSGERQVFYGAHIDQSSRLNEEGITDLLDKTVDHHDCLILVAHQINNAAYKFQITTERLRWLAAAAYKRNLRFITIRDITL